MHSDFVLIMAGRTNGLHGMAKAMELQRVRSELIQKLCSSEYEVQDVIDVADTVAWIDSQTMHVGVA